MAHEILGGNVKKCRVRILASVEVHYNKSPPPSHTDMVLVVTINFYREPPTESSAISPRDTPIQTRATVLAHIDEIGGIGLPIHSRRK